MQKQKRNINICGEQIFASPIITHTQVLVFSIYTYIYILYNTKKLVLHHFDKRQIFRHNKKISSVSISCIWNIFRIVIKNITNTKICIMSHVIAFSI